MDISFFHTVTQCEKYYVLLRKSDHTQRFSVKSTPYLVTSLVKENRWFDGKKNIDFSSSLFIVLFHTVCVGDLLSPLLWQKFLESNAITKEELIRRNMLLHDHCAGCKGFAISRGMK